MEKERIQNLKWPENISDHFSRQGVQVWLTELLMKLSVLIVSRGSFSVITGVIETL